MPMFDSPNFLHGIDETLHVADHFFALIVIFDCVHPVASETVIA